MKPVRILTTGGTLDKVHDWRTENIAFAGQGKSQVPEVLDNGRCYFPAVEQLFQIDSLEMTETYRQLILERVMAAKEEAIVITHGTSTMDQTAHFLAKRNLGKTIVLTGAMRPFSLFVSDAGFNLGGAIIAAQALDHGVYGVMNGRVIPAASLKKNEQLGRFDA
ncbi:asparaginase domain-containing protein [Parvularcula sp. LCG005]|uniref:asparaginase domain-containing protein n=1 Tax=Parvularcula sp. LCG005 TaxID=3078805 RepID=UPI002942AEEB|nr:asparaginase domain-containing protein [Parvularcula sp. LCG005]WOI53294.1 asparaginase domain-containing protein [Parvularcula sp. LCG005]